MIKLTGLTKRYPGRSVTANAVDGIDLDIPEGKLVTLLGPSGCGKTTTLRLIAGLERADAGVVEIGGQVVSDPALFLVRPGTVVIGTTMLDTFLQGFVGPVASLAMVQVGVTVIVLALGTFVFKVRVTGGHDA
jgi:ABC-type multidrug transport system ATPase subunit